MINLIASSPIENINLWIKKDEMNFLKIKICESLT